tara:strand:- start:208 stop:1032 length:825 start_codon:yes stop_codon:yes gene_type:complete
MNPVEKAKAFAALHQAGKPVMLYNIWDAGSARVAVRAGAKAVATGSWSVAEAQGYEDGEALPLALLETIAARITASVSVPVSIDFEGGYARDADTLYANATRIIAAGAVGINFEDRIVSGGGLYPVEAQSSRISAIRSAADDAGVPLFINARTDHFLAESDRAKHAALLSDTLERAEAYAHAGANGFFVPGLADLDLIARVCEGTSLPVNVMMFDGMPPASELARVGVARISFGPGPYRQAMKDLDARYREAVSDSLLVPRDAPDDVADIVGDQ